MASTSLALVTGSSSGIGFELAKLSADDGYDLVVAVEDDAIRASADKLATAGVELRSAQVGLRNPRGVQRVAASPLSKAMGLANRELPDSVNAVASRMISRPVRRK
jgi:NAD(P)-dependent dehydrogenase (short-subunit alcohol dehydrogenase family)